ncbi:hypothetical protein ACHAXR_013475, partial [Thalassiosira sp. AJA248-18]
QAQQTVASPQSPSPSTQKPKLALPPRNRRLQNTSMAFSFGAPAPAPAAGGFSFGGGAPAAAAAPAPTSLFGQPAPAPATTGGGLFGAPAAPAPAATGGGLFGAPAPAPAGGGLFGSTPAPAPGGGLFGSTAPAPVAGGGLFGSTAPAPATTGLFGSTPAPAAGGLFGATPAPSPAGGLFGATAPLAAPPMAMAQQQHPFSGNTPYSQLPDNAKRAIDQIYQLMMQHRRTLASVKTMAPSLLVVENAPQDGSGGNVNSARGENPSPADAAAGSPRRTIPSGKATTTSAPLDPSSEPLPQQMTALQTQIQTLLQSAESNLTEAQQLKGRVGEAAVQAKMHGAWPIENVAARRGVALSSIKGMLGDSNNNAQSTTAPLGGTVPAGAGNSNGTPASSLNVSGMTNIDAIALQQIMDIRAAHVDRIESIPSPYFWEVLHNFEQRMALVHRDVEKVRARLAIAEEAERVQAIGAGGARMMIGDETSLLLANGGNNVNAMASLMVYEGGGASAPLSKRLATLARSQNDLFLHVAAQAAHAHEGLDEMKLRYQRFCQTTKGGYYEDPFLKADVEEVSREREMQQRIMGEQLATATPLSAPPVAQGVTGGAPIGGLFGQRPPAPAAAGGLFGAPGKDFAFVHLPLEGCLVSPPLLLRLPLEEGCLVHLVRRNLVNHDHLILSHVTSYIQSAPAPTSTGGLFGTTAPAPAPSGGGLFGSAPAPAAGGGLFGSTTAPAPARKMKWVVSLLTFRDEASFVAHMFLSSLVLSYKLGEGSLALPRPHLQYLEQVSSFLSNIDSRKILFSIQLIKYIFRSFFHLAPTTPASTLAPRKKGSRSGGRRR